jgi:hypothetical protein
MELKNISNTELIQGLEKLARTERKITHLILLHIIEIEDRKLYAELGYDGMYSYLTRGLGYSEGSAYRRLQSARLLKQMPSIAKKIEDGSLNLTQLAQVRKCMTSIKDPTSIPAKEAGGIENPKISERTSESPLGRALEVLNQIENKNSYETQKILASKMNLPVQVHEKIKPQSDTSVRIEITFSEEQFQELKKAKDLLSHVCPGGSWAEVITTLAERFNQKKLNDRSNASGKSHDRSPRSRPKKTPPLRRKSISVHIKRQLFDKAQHCCQYINPKTGQRCQSQFQLEIDHIYPFALGGQNDIGNLRILCKTHNALAARQWGLA